MPGFERDCDKRDGTTLRFRDGGRAERVRWRRVLIQTTVRPLPISESALPGIIGIIACVALQILVATSNMFPNGAVLGVPFRTALYLIVALATALLIVFARAVTVRGPILYGAALIGLVLLASIHGLIGSTVPDSYILDDTRTYLVTFTIPMFAAILVRLGVITIGQLAKPFVIGSLVYAMVKLVLWTVLLLLPPVAQVVLLALRENNVNGGASQVAGEVSRIQTGLDFAILVSMLFLFRSRVPLLPRWLRWPALVILGVALIITFSRMLVALFAILILIEFFAYTRGKAFKFGLSILIAFVVGLGAVAGNAIQNRLETGHAGDLTRVRQADALIDLWEGHPVFGAGLGAFSNVVIRDTKGPYNYELQLHSILTKVGVVGALALIGFAFLAFVVSSPLPPGALAWQVGCFLAFLAAGSTNPYLFSSAAANVYMALFVMIGVLADQNGRSRAQGIAQ